MPILHARFRARHAEPSHEKSGILHPSLALSSQGPCVQAMIGVARSIESQLITGRHPVPAPLSGVALIDTGASSTCVDESIARRLELPVVDVVNISSASHPSTVQNVYPIQITITGLSASIEAPKAIGAALAPQGLVALIGRDVLRYCALFYNGVGGEITLSI